MSRISILTLVLLPLALGLWLSCDKDPKDPQPMRPDAPTLLAIISFSQTEVEMNWADQSVDETGFRIERKQGGGDWQTDGLVDRNIIHYTSTGLTPATPYTYRVWSYNDVGDSDSSSNERAVTTLSDELAPYPTGVMAEALGPTVVRVTWDDPGELDSFRIERGPDNAVWTTLGHVADGVEEYEDALVEPDSTYFYRVGSVNVAGVNWSTTVVEVTTPAVGTPAPPSNLTAEFDLTTGITLEWQDNASDELGFHISRNLSGELFANIDTVEADVTTYFDASVVGVDNVFGYKVRAYNELGNSLWSNIVNVDFTYHSEGTIPLYISPPMWWHYDVDDVENDVQYQIERIVRGVKFVQGVDHYGVIETTFPGASEVDTLYYLRNFAGVGCKGALWPVTEASTSELLFQHPAQTPGSAGSRYHFHGDSVIVLLRSHIVTIGDSTYTGVIAYQRFYQNSDSSIKYYIVPNTIGIIKEEEFLGSTHKLTRTVFDYRIDE